MTSMSPDSKLSPRSAPLLASSRISDSRRSLACVLCQQRKVKCDRKSPCANCLKFKAECIPAALNPRQRKRRFPERELLERIRKYEDLLRRNKVTFDPLHKDASGNYQTSSRASGLDTDDEQPDSMTLNPSSLSTSEKPKEPREPKYVWFVSMRKYLHNVNYLRNFWNAMTSQGVRLLPFQIPSSILLMIETVPTKCQ